MSTRDVMEFLVNNAAPALPPTGLAEIFDRMIWTLEDNGAGVLTTARQWLDDANDIVRIRIALAMKEGFLYEDRSSMLASFRRLTGRYPDVGERCNQIVRAWDQHFG
jgi:hypothetical protein